MPRHWNPFAAKLVRLTPAQRRLARLSLIYEVPFAALFIWFIWIHIWVPGWPVWTMLLLGALSALALFSAATSVRQAWFLEPDRSDD